MDPRTQFLSSLSFTNINWCTEKNPRTVHQEHWGNLELSENPFVRGWSGNHHTSPLVQAKPSLGLSDCQDANILIQLMMLSYVWWQEAPPWCLHLSWRCFYSSPCIRYMTIETLIAPTKSKKEQFKSIQFLSDFLCILSPAKHSPYVHDADKVRTFRLCEPTKGLPKRPCLKFSSTFEFSLSYFHHQKVE